LGERSGVVSSFTIIKGALVTETYEAFRHWDFRRGPALEHHARLKELERLRRKSANWLRDLGKVLNRRFDPNGRDRPLVRMAQAGWTSLIWRPLSSGT
jgi:hypothetical protein